MIGGSSDTRDAIEVILTPVIKPCTDANTEAEAALANFQYRLQENHANYCADLAEIIGTMPELSIDMAPFEGFAEDLAVVEKSIRNLSIRSGEATAATLLEVAFIKPTISMLRRVFGAVLAKLAGKASAAAIFAAADGPLPVGDMVSAGLFIFGGICMVRDIHMVTKVLPGELTAGLTEAIDSYEQQLTASVLERAQELVNSFDTSSENLSEKIMKNIEE